MRAIPTLLLTGLLTFPAALGCAPIDREPLTEKPLEPAPIRSLVVLSAAPQLEQNSLEVNVHQLQKGTEVLDELYAEYFEGVDEVTLLPEERLEALSFDLTGSRLERARRIAEKLGSDAVLVTAIERFFEREGTNYAVDNPASVAFNFQLLRVDSDRVACVGQFAETQKPLTENIFALPQAASRGFKWLTARELARDGLRRELEECEQVQQLRGER